MARMLMKNILLASLVIVILILPNIATMAGSLEIKTDNSPTRRVYRPLVGGIRIFAVISGGQPPPGITPESYVYGNACTIGYPAKIAGTGTIGFVTAKHCAASTAYPIYQPDPYPEYFVGYPYRMSDAIDSEFVRAISVSVSKKILHIYTSNGDYNLKKIKGKIPWNDTSYIGELVYKTGQRTGTTHGTLYEYRSYYKGHKYVVLVINMNVAKGDSGAPLYWIHPELGDLYIIGIIIGKDNDDGYVVGIHWKGPAVKLGVVPLVAG